MNALARTPRGKGSTLQRIFNDHPRSLGESYWAHQSRAVSFGSQLIVAGVACVIHALVPSLFPRTASETIRRLHLQMSRSGRLKTSPQLQAVQVPPAALSHH
jgi:Family of unknown function (DUF6356)